MTVQMLSVLLTEMKSITVRVNKDEDVFRKIQVTGHGRCPFKPYLGVLQKMKMYTRTTRD